MIRALKRVVPDRIKKRGKLWLHSGKKYLCPFCGYRSKDLAPLGRDFPVLREKQVIGAGARNAKCWKCDSTDRERLIYTFLKYDINIFDEHTEYRILHLAPEKRLTKRLLEVGFKEYICGDLLAEGYSYSDHVVSMDVLDIPYNSDAFDLVICNHLLEHIVDDIKAMTELFRVLSPGGMAILQVPISKNSLHTLEDASITDPKQRELTFGQFDHVRIYGQDYTERLRSVGFKVDRINISGKYEQFGLNMDEDIFAAKKL